MPTRALDVEPNDWGDGLTRGTQLLAKRTALGDELPGEDGVVGRGESARHACDRSFKLRLTEGGANGGANGATFARVLVDATPKGADTIRPVFPWRRRTGIEPARDGIRRLTPVLKSTGRGPGAT